VLVGLEFDHQIDFFTNEDVGVALCDLRIVAIVERDELDALGRRSRLEAERDFFRKLVVGALRRVAQPV